MKTVFVVGAGASFDLGLPIGSGLKEKISDALNFDENQGQPIGDKLLFQPIAQNNLFEAAEAIQEGLSQSLSIDNFIHNHRANDKIVSCGKLCIVREILKSESESWLNFKFRRSVFHDSVRSHETWHNSLVKRITEDCTIDNLKDRLRSTAFVVFNYDRCLEEYLFHSLKNIYRLTDEEAAGFVNDMDIYHPYGIAGYLPWQNKSEGRSIDFGGDPSESQLQKISNEIKTFTEENSGDEIRDIRYLLKSSDRIVFLGFAFAKQNLDLILPLDGGSFNNPIEVYGTGLGISVTDNFLIGKDLIKRINCESYTIKPSISFRDCKELFEEYSRTLSFN